MPNLGAPELLVIVLVALVIFGPRKLPELARTAGQAMREFRRHTGAVQSELRASLDVTPPTVAIPATADQVVLTAAPAPAPTAAGTPPAGDRVS